MHRQKNIHQQKTLYITIYHIGGTERLGKWHGTSWYGSAVARNVRQPLCKGMTQHRNGLRFAKRTTKWTFNKGDHCVRTPSAAGETPGPGIHNTLY